MLGVYDYSKMKTVTVATTVILVLFLCVSLSSALEAKARVYVDPTHIPLNGVVNIHIEAYDPPDDDPDVPNDFLYILVHQVVVRYPAGPYTEEYMLGTASDPGISGQKIRIDYGEDIAIPYGPGVGAITIDGNVYYWWRTRKGGNPVWPNERIDLVLNPSPTGWSGRYEVNVEGINYYGSSEQDIRLESWFDIPANFEVPELALPISAVATLGFALVLLKLRRKN
jgi:hypothetical protein